MMMLENTDLAGASETDHRYEDHCMLTEWPH